MQLEPLIDVLQIAIGPVILISGVGLLLLSMTNRLGRTIDRCRQLVELRRSGTEDDRRRCNAQLELLWRRARLLRSSIGLAACSILFACLMILFLFVGVLMDLHIALGIILLFAACVLSVIGSMLFFIGDINLSLKALELEIDGKAGI